MSYKVIDIANKLIAMAQKDEPNGGELLTNMKLQKLLYYQQGYHLAEFDKPLFNEPVEAWIYGPVVPVAYDFFKSNGQSGLEFNSECVSLNDNEEKLFGQVFEAFRDFSAIGLMNKSHEESPWIESTPHRRGTIISQEKIKNFFKKQLE